MSISLASRFAWVRINISDTLQRKKQMLKCLSCLFVFAIRRKNLRNKHLTHPHLCLSSMLNMAIRWWRNGRATLLHPP